MLYAFELRSRPPRQEFRLTQQLRDTVLHAITSLQIKAATRAAHIEETWATASPWTRAAHRIGWTTLGIAATTIAFRTTGAAAHGLDDALSLNLPNPTLPVAPHTSLNSPPAARLEIEGAIKAAPLAANLAEATDHGIDLPADTTKAPGEVSLGTYRSTTKEGTVWKWAEHYAAELGYTKLTNRQEWLLTNELLKTNDTTWAEARTLQPDFAMRFPTQQKAIALLEDAGANQIQIADRPSLPAPAPPPLPNPPETADIPPIPPPSIDTCTYPNWLPFIGGEPPLAIPFIDDCTWKNRNLMAALGLGGVLAVTYGYERQVLRPQRQLRHTQRRTSAAAAPSAPTSRTITPTSAATSAHPPRRQRFNTAVKTAATAFVASRLMERARRHWLHRKRKEKTKKR